MKTPLDYEPPQPREPDFAFWIVFIVAGLTTVLVASDVMRQVVGPSFALYFLVGMVVTGASIAWARWTGPVLVAVLAGVLGPPAVVMLIIKLVAAFS